MDKMKIVKGLKYQVTYGSFYLI